MDLLWCEEIYRLSVGTDLALSKNLMKCLFCKIHFSRNFARENDRHGYLSISFSDAFHSIPYLDTMGPRDHHYTVLEVCIIKAYIYIFF